MTRVVHAVRTRAFAGVERHVALLAATQQEQGHDVSVIGGDPLRMERHLGAAGVDHVPVSRRTGLTGPLRSALSGGHVDVVHAHMTAAELAALLARATLPRAGRPAVVTTRHFAAPRGSSRWARRPLARAARGIAAQIAISRYVADRVEGTSVVVHPGVPSAPEPVPAEARRPVVLVVQRLEEEKRTDVALAAFAASGLAHEGWRLEVAGGGSRRAALEEQAARLGIGGSVALLGRRDDVEDLMRRAAVMLAPCPVEGLGLAVLEAMAAGLPVVASAAGGHLETLGASTTEFLHPPDDAATAGRLLVRLAHDPGLRDDYGLLLRRTQQEGFTLEAQAEATEQVYRSLR